MFSLFSKKAKSKVSTQEVAQYYDVWTDRYLGVGRRIIEAFRPTTDEELIEHYIRSARLSDAQVILDAGCGVGAVAYLMAQAIEARFEGLTISSVQVARAHKFANDYSLKGTVNVKQGDYHRLGDYYPAETFDRVLFFESLGHSTDVNAVVSGLKQVMKSGGMVYIKDFFQKEASMDAAFDAKCRDVVANINRLYSYNTLELHETISAFRRQGFELQYIKKPDFQDDISIRFLFEAENGINIFGEYEPFVPTDWLEMLWRKP